MRIVYWNCGGAFQRKWESIAALEPDVAIIAECCEPEQLSGFDFNSGA